MKESDSENTKCVGALNSGMRRCGDAEVPRGGTILQSSLRSEVRRCGDAEVRAEVQ